MKTARKHDRFIEELGDDLILTPGFGFYLRTSYCSFGHMQSPVSGLTFEVCYGVQAVFASASNLVPRAHVPFGQHQDTELWNNQFPETKILGLLASQRMRGLV